MARVLEVVSEVEVVGRNVDSGLLSQHNLC